MDIMNQLIEDINDQVNSKIRYIPDDERDIWQPPQETIERGAGDCEDFAILKFFLLLNNDIPEDNLRLCYCTYIGIPHMVVLVYDSGTWHVLDNNTYAIFTVGQYVAIKEKFRFNRNGIWIGEKKTRHDPLSRMKKWRDVVSIADAFESLQIA